MPTTDHVYVVHRNDTLNNEIDVFDDWHTAERFAAAVDGYITEEPILHADDEYVLQNLALGEDASFLCDVCGRIGNADDGISGDSTECPDEDCPGTVHLIGND